MMIYLSDINFSQLLHDIDLACEGKTNEGKNSLANSSELDEILKKAKIYHNSCIDSSSNARESSSIIDTKFESILLSCTSADQKETKKR